MATIIELLTDARSSLNDEEAVQEAEYLMEAICGISRSHQFIHPNEALIEEQCQQFNAALKRRIAGEPLAYITGSRGFWDMDLQVTPDVLIPRPDTECLVEQALQRIPEGATWQIADLGTGSGAIALALAREHPQCDITATDMSEAALSIARKNASLQNIQNICFIVGSWFKPINNRRFEMIVCNPPYIPADDPHLKEGDLPSEPKHALVSGADGLEDIRQIVVDSPSFLEPGGWLLMEHGYDQAAEISNLMQHTGFRELFTRQDYGGNDRITGGRKA